MNDTPRATGNQAGAFTCPGCDQRRPFTEFGSGVFNERMAPGEAAPVCSSCTWRAFDSPTLRERIERTVRRQKRGPGTDRVVILDPEYFEISGV